MLKVTQQISGKVIIRTQGQSQWLFFPARAHFTAPHCCPNPKSTLIYRIPPSHARDARILQQPTAFWEVTLLLEVK